MNDLDYMIEYLAEENKDIPKSYFSNSNLSKEEIWRALCNIRDAKEVDMNYIEAQNRYLKERLENIKLTSVDEINNLESAFPDSNIKNKDKISIWKGDISTLKIQAIVNAANSKGLGCFQPLHYCIDNQIQTFAGVQMRLECDKYMKTINYNLKTGEAFLTKGYNLPSKYVIHTVGPIITFEVNDIAREKLANCYINSLKLAIENDIKTIAFPCISTGVFRFPIDEASKIAITAVDKFLSENKEKIDRVIFNVYSDNDLDVYINTIKNI